MSKRRKLMEAADFERGIAFSVPNKNLEAVTYVGLESESDVQGVVCTIIQCIETASLKEKFMLLNVILNSAAAIVEKNPEALLLFKNRLGNKL